MNTMLHRIAETFDPSAFLDALALWLPNAVVAVLTVLAFWMFNRFVGRAAAFFMRRGEIDETAVAFVQTLIRYTVFAVALVTVLGQLGIDVSGILASLGVAGLTIGFAARDALSNIISGLFIFWDRPFVIGDLVEVGEHYGRVAQITMRSTRVVTPDGRMLAIPNSTIVNGVVASYTNFPNLRLDVSVTIGVEEDLGRVREILVGLVTGHPDFLDDRPPKVVMTAINDYNVEVQLRAWLRDEKQHIAARTDLRERMFEALRTAEVNLPYETFALAPIEVRKASA